VPVGGGERPRLSGAGRERLTVDDRRLRLLELGLRLFSERTYEEVAIDDIARVAGISKGLLYHYFPSKREYYVETVRHAAGQLVVRTDPARVAAGAAHTGSVPRAAPASPLDEVRVGLIAYLDFVERHASAYATLLRSGVGADPEVLAIVEGTRERFAARLLAGAGLPATSPPVRVAVRGWIGFVEAAVLDWIDHRDLTPPALADLCAQVLMTTLAAAMAPPAAGSRR
jgi:AcrR family transcriptional regulator